MMINLNNFNGFLKESIKYLNQSELFQWLEKRRDRIFIALDTETTGFKRGPRGEQLVQISAVSYKFDYDLLQFEEIGFFDESIRLNPDTMGRLEDPDLINAFKINRYQMDQDNKRSEQEVLNSLNDFVESYPSDSILIIQNAHFDMPMINIRRELGGIRREIFDSLDLFGFLLVPTLEKMAETDEEARDILKEFGFSASGKYYSTSLPNVARGMGVSSTDAHNSLSDCRYMIRVVERALNFIKENQVGDLSQYSRKKHYLERKRKMYRRK